MAKTLIGNVKGSDGRGIASIDKTGTTGSVDTYTITYTDGTESTYEVNNSDSVAIQRQIVPSAAVESSTTASQAYSAGDYVVVAGALRKVTSAIASGSTIGDSNSTATTVTGEISTALDSISPVLLVNGQIKSGESRTVRGIADWLMIGVYASTKIADSSDREIMVPCLVGDMSVLGSGGCAISGGYPRYISVRFSLSGEVLKYESVVMQEMSDGKLYGSRNVNGIVGLIRR